MKRFQKDDIRFWSSSRPYEDYSWGMQMILDIAFNKRNKYTLGELRYYYL